MTEGHKISLLAWKVVASREHLMSVEKERRKVCRIKERFKERTGFMFLSTDGYTNDMVQGESNRVYDQAEGFSPLYEQNWYGRRYCL